MLKKKDGTVGTWKLRLVQMQAAANCQSAGICNNTTNKAKFP